MNVLIFLICWTLSCCVLISNVKAAYKLQCDRTRWSSTEHKTVGNYCWRLMLQLLSSQLGLILTSNLLGIVDHRRCVLRSHAASSTWLLFSFIIISHLSTQDILEMYSGNVLREANILEFCYWKCVSERPGHFCEMCGKSDSLKMCQESFAQPGSHQTNYHLRPAQPGIKLQRQAIWKCLKRALLSEEVMKKIM
jgi:hypothetical protein